MVKTMVGFGIGIVLRILNSISLFLKVSQWCKNKEIQIIHFNNKLSVNAWGIIIARIFGYKSVCHVRGHESSKIIVRVVAKFVDNVVATSRGVFDNLVSLGVPSDKIKLILPSIDLNECSRLANLGSKRFDGNDCTFHKIGMVGMLQKRKGCEIFIQAAKCLIDSRSDCNFLLIGDTPSNAEQKYKLYLYDLVKNLGICEHFEFCGFNENVFKALKSLDVVVFPSLLPEGFGRTIIEALAMEKPVIASEVPGPAEIIENGKTGILIKKGSAESLAKAIRELIDNLSYTRELGRNGKIIVENRYSVFREVLETKTLYSSLLTNAKNIITTA